MAKTLVTPTSPHFILPILPCSLHRPTIPVSFFRHVEAENRQESALLRSDGSERTWRVKIDGRQFTVGWEEFAAGHNLSVGDILLFRHEGRMVFHVTVFDPSGCDRQYSRLCKVESENTCTGEEDDSDDEETSDDSDNLCTEEDDSDNYEETSDDDDEEEDDDEDSSPSNVTHFVATVTSYTLRTGRMHIPQGFARANDWQKRLCNVVIMNEERISSWSSCLRLNKSNGHVYIGGWRKICFENYLKEGDSCGLKLISNGRTPVLKMMKPAFSSQTTSRSSREVPVEKKVPGEKEIKKKMTTERTRKVACSASNGNPRFLTMTVTPSSLDRGELNIPIKFARANNLDRRLCSIEITNKEGRSWLLCLKFNKMTGQVPLGGWRKFCHENDLNVGDAFKLELISNGATPVMNMMKLPAFSGQTPGCSREVPVEKKVKKTRTRVTCSASKGNPRFLTLNVTQSNLERDALFLPLSFSRANGLHDGQARGVTLVDGKGNSWPTKQWRRQSHERVSITHGWRSFCYANEFKEGDSVLLEHVPDDEKIVLKLCSRVKAESLE